MCGFVECPDQSHTHFSIDFILFHYRMKRSNSTSMIPELLQSGMVGVSMEEHRGDGNGIGLRGKRNLSTSNASLPGDLAISLPWASPIRRQVSFEAVLVGNCYIT